MPGRVNRKPRFFAIKAVESAQRTAYLLPRGTSGNHPMSKDLSPKQAARKERDDRLAAELRENLKRRKAQARARGGTASSQDKQDR
jgi:hypothetical protein